MDSESALRSARNLLSRVRALQTRLILPEDLKAWDHLIVDRLCTKTKLNYKQTASQRRSEYNIVLPHVYSVLIEVFFMIMLKFPDHQKMHNASRFLVPYMF
ncbi:hypothetical protein PoB_006970400 [Plakobranchus ocellatus]|uniref:Uncharacterized protein n=1 Tax=Plakobranchus ocellatus TaxID=259542 RepID=A0AAV4DGQ1_9GAST|nr:hypothetical protein PoB_006970400 [Plakobranchus ocellatus]